MWRPHGCTGRRPSKDSRRHRWRSPACTCAARACRGAVTRPTAGCSARRMRATRGPGRRWTLLHCRDDAEAAHLFQDEGDDDGVAEHERARELAEHHVRAGRREAQHGGPGHLEALERRALAADELRLTRHRRMHAGDDVAVLAGALEIEVDEGAGALAHGAPLVGRTMVPPASITVG